MEDNTKDPKTQLPDGDRSGTARPRGRLVFALGASVLLAMVIGIVVVTGSEEEAEAQSPCVAAWNGDAIATGTDGTHAYADHSYRATLVTRMTPDGELLSPDSDDAGQDDVNRCVVVFATPEVVREPDFGVRVFEDGRWSSLILLDKKVELEEIEKIQQDAVATANATLLPTGLLSEN